MEEAGESDEDLCDSPGQEYSNILDAMVIASSVYLIIMSEPALSNLSLDPMRVMFHFCMETIK